MKTSMLVGLVAFAFIAVGCVSGKSVQQRGLAKALETLKKMEKTLHTREEEVIYIFFISFKRDVCYIWHEVGDYFRR